MLTVQNVIDKIQADPTLDGLSKLRLVEIVLNEAPSTTPLEYLMQVGMGGVVGNLVARYFGLGFVGRTAATLAGASAGPSLAQRIFGR